MNNNRYQQIVDVLVKGFFENLNLIKSLLERKEFIEDKGGGDITYDFDLKIEELIYNLLRKELGDVLVLGEERKYGHSSDGSFFLVDPVDGSTNAKKGLPIYGSLISFFATKELSGLKVGVVWDIPRERVFTAIKGEGAHLYYSSSVDKLSIKQIKDESKDEMLYDISPHSPLEAILKMDKFGKFRHLGSLGMSICFVCEGGLDLSIDISGRARMVDVLSPLLILSECGGYYVLEPETPIDPSTKVIYIAGRSKEVVESVYEEIWKFKKI